MSASTPLFDATIEPDEDPFPTGNIGSTGRPRAEPVVLTPGPATNNNNATSVQGGNANDAEMGIVSLFSDRTDNLSVKLNLDRYHDGAGWDLPELLASYGPRSPLLFPLSSAGGLCSMRTIHRQLCLEREFPQALSTD